MRGWSPDQALALAVKACRAAGVNGEIEPLRMSTNGVFKVGDLCLRVCRPATISVEMVCSHRLVAQWLNDHDVPSLRPGHIEPFAINGAACAFWLWEEHDMSQKVSPYDCGVLLARMHAALRSVSLPSRVPDWATPLNALTRLASISDHPLLSSADVAHITSAYGKLLYRLRSCRPMLPAQLIHGDPNLSNIILTDRGWTIIDLDDVSHGQPEWDLVRFHSLPHYDEFVAGYGLDASQWEGFVSYTWLLWLGGMIWGLRQDLTVLGFRPLAAAERELNWWRVEGRQRLEDGEIPLG